MSLSLGDGVDSSKLSLVLYRTLSGGAVSQIRHHDDGINVPNVSVQSNLTSY